MDIMVMMGGNTQVCHIQSSFPSFLTYALGLPGGMGEAYGPTFGAGDVIGVGLDNASNNIFFTKNGRYLGMHISPLYYSAAQINFNTRAGL